MSTASGCRRSASTRRAKRRSSVRQPSSWAPGRASTGRGPASPRSTIGSTSCCVQRCPSGAPACSRCSTTRPSCSTSRSPSRARASSPSSGSSGLEIGVLGDLLASCFDVNLAVWAGAASEVEDQAVRWVSEFIAYPAEAGAFTSGGTISNVGPRRSARAGAARLRRAGMAAASGALYCSQEAHYSVVRARRSCSAWDRAGSLAPG